MPLLNFFSKRRYLSIELNDPIMISNLKNNGFCWIRRHNKQLFSVLRFPTVGCILEVSKEWDIGYVPIDSPTGKKLIQRICYF